MKNIEKTNPFASLHYREFRSFISMRFFFIFAYQMQAVIIGFHIYYLTKDTLSLAIMGLCEAVPAISIALYGGYVADKSEKRTLLIKICLSVFILSWLMLFITSPTAYRYFSSRQTIIIMYGIIGCTGIVRGFFNPTIFSLMAEILPKKLYPNGATWSSLSWQTASIAGPAVGGLAYGFYGITVTYGLIIFFIFISLVCLFFFKLHPPKFIPKENTYKNLSEGISFVFKSKMMFNAMCLDFFSVFFGGAVALLPVFANDILKVGAEGLGFMRAATSTGAVITMLAMTKFSPMKRPWRNLLVAVTGFAISIICYGLSKNFYLTLFLLFCEGAFDSVSVIIRSTIIQLLTPDHIRGRVLAVNQIFIGSSNEIGAFESGLTAKLMRTVPAVVFGGCMTLSITGIVYLKTKNLLSFKLDNIKPAEKGENQI